MKTKLLISVCVAVALAVGIALAQEKEQTKPGTDPRIGKLVEQNEQIIKTQQEILQRLEKIEQGLLQVRRRGS